MNVASTVREFAPAKINLYLHVLGRRDDGYHDLDLLVAFADVGDDIELVPDSAYRVTVAGPFADAVPTDQTNLALRAAIALGEALGRDDGVHVRLVKNLPVAAGVGGGSSDAAAVLRGLARLWQIGPSLAFPSVAQDLGADVPVCLLRRAARLSGIGDAEPSDLAEPLDLVLANDGRAVSTATVFAGLETFGAPAPEAGRDDLVEWLSRQRNDLEPSARTLAPGISDVLAALNDSAGCRLARMSGSGGTCFAVYTSAGEAQAAADKLGSAHPGWWVKAAKVS